MEALDEFQQNHRVIEDFASTTLAGIPGDLCRLLHVATLRDMATGRYRHAGLETIYSEPAVHQALWVCHQELFERILETSLERQEVELRKCLEGLGDCTGEIAGRWQEHEFYRVLIPSGVPSYLRELFCSNIGVLLDLIAEESSNPRPNA
ncbi:MAG: hypothetical protein WBE21_16750 [Candidatus Acidiferrales bacterium]|jgi:hypothetical protein|nr:hypothetical protein [Candidatus Acidoferrales bacterium]